MADQESCGHARIEVVTRCPDGGKELGHAEFRREQLRRPPLKPEELAAEAGADFRTGSSCRW
jgi:hypothetical protein